MDNQENLTLDTEEKTEEQQKEPEMAAESTENVSRETLDGFKISFDAKYDDIFEGLEATDKADGTNLKARKLFLVIAVLFLMQVAWFAYTRSGIALIFVVLLGAMSYMLKKKIQKLNKEIAKEFEAEGKQNVILGEDVLQLNEKTVSYSEVATLYEFKHSFSLIYQGNHVYIIPKNVLEEGQAEQFAALMKEKIGDKYQNISKK